MIYSMTNLANVSFQRNQLANVPANAFVNPSGLQNIDFSRNQLTSFEFWTFFVQKTVNFAFNRIITITNKNFISLPFNSTSARTISLTGNGPILDLSDAVYEMYNACYEAVEVLELNGSTGAIFDPMLAKGLASIDFGTTQLNCTCAQSFIENVLSVTLAGRPWITSSFPIYNASCTSGSLFGRDLCLPASPPPISDVDFSQVSPRLCKIYPYEPGNLTVVPNITAPTLNVVRFINLSIIASEFDTEFSIWLF